MSVLHKKIFHNMNIDTHTTGSPGQSYAVLAICLIHLPVLLWLADKPTASAASSVASAAAASVMASKNSDPKIAPGGVNLGSEGIGQTRDTQGNAMAARRAERGK